MNNKNILNKKIENFSSSKLDWNIIQVEMRNKLGTDIYESWLRKIEFVEKIMYCCQYQQDLLETGLHQGI